MIQHDHISEIFIVLGSALSIYLFTISGTVASLLPAVLIILGLVLHRFVQHKRNDEFDDTPIEDEHLWKNFIFFTVVAIFGVFVVDEAVTYLPLAMNVAFVGIYALIFYLDMSIAEEVFFRGFFTDWMLISLPNPYLAIFLSAGVFALYHLAVYGTVLSSLLYVFLGGIILSWVAFRTQHVSPCIAGHLINNFGAWISQNGIPTSTSQFIRVARIILRLVTKT